MSGEWQAVGEDSASESEVQYCSSTTSAPANGASLPLPSLTRASKQETQVVYVLLLKAFSFIGFVQ